MSPGIYEYDAKKCMSLHFTQTVVIIIDLIVKYHCLIFKKDIKCKKM